MNFDSLGGLACLHAVQIALLSGIVLALVKLFAKDRPHLAHALWALVLLKCLTPPVIASPLSPFSWLGTERRVASSVDTAAATLPVQLDSSPSPTIRITYHPPSEAAAPVLPGPQIPATSKSLIFSIGLFAGAAWLAGTILIGLILCWRVTAYARLIRRKTIATPTNLQDLTNKLHRKLGVRRAVHVRVVDGPIGPAVVGLLRPTLLLPDCIVRSQSRLNLQPLIAHELVHVRRGDLWWSAVQTIASLLWWFHPCVWLASRLLTRETERSCDEETIVSLGCRPADYARSLLDVLERKSEIVAAPLVPGVRPVDITLKRMERIMRIGHGSHPRTPRWVTALLLIGATLALPGARWLGAQEGDTNLKERPADVESSSGKRLPRPPRLQNELNSAAQPAPKLDITSPAHRGKDLIILNIQILDVPTELVKELLAESQRKDDSQGVSTAQLSVAAEEVTYDAQLKEAVFSDLGVVGNLVIHENRASGNPEAVTTASGSSAETRIASQSTQLPTVLDSERLATIDGWLASKSETKVERINAPRITTHSGVRATCTIGQQRPFVRALEGPQDKQPSIQVVQTGLTCDFTPTLNDPDGLTVEVLCSLAKTEIDGVLETEKTTDDGSTVTLQHPTINKQEVTFNINVPNGGTFAATLGTKHIDAGETTTLYVVSVNVLAQPEPSEQTGSDAAEAQPAIQENQAASVEDALAEFDAQFANISQPKNEQEQTSSTTITTKELQREAELVCLRWRTAHPKASWITVGSAKARKTISDECISIMGPVISRAERKRMLTRPLTSPSDDEILQAAKDQLDKSRSEQIAALASPKIIKEAVADYIYPTHVVPKIGPAKLHHRHYKCTIYATRELKDVVDVVYIDHRHFIMVGSK